MSATIRMEWSGSQNNNGFRWKYSPESGLGVFLECYHEGELIAKAAGSGGQYSVDILRRNAPGQRSDFWAKMRVQLQNYDIHGAIEHYIKNGVWPWYAKDFEHEDFMTQINNKEAIKRGSIMDQFFDDDGIY